MAPFHSFLWVNNIPKFQQYSTTHTHTHTHTVYHIFFIHSSVDGHLRCFHDLATVNSATVNTGCMHLFKLWFSSDLGMGLLGHMLALYFSFFGTSILFYIVCLYFMIDNYTGFRILSWEVFPPQYFKIIVFLIILSHKRSDIALIFVPLYVTFPFYLCF